MTSPPSREVLLEMARAKNATPLPVPKPTCGLRLPPDRHCLTACNYKLKFKPKPRPPGFGGGLKVGGGGGGGIKAQHSKMAVPAARNMQPKKKPLYDICEPISR